MALFKILKGTERKDSSGKSLMLTPTSTNGVPAIHEGWAYVTTDEGNMYVDVSDTRRVKINAKSDLALQAISDDLGQRIAETYIKGIALTKHKTAPFYTAAYGDNNTFTIEIPVANEQEAGVITADTQMLAGHKIFTSPVTITGAEGTSPLRVRNIVGLNGSGTTVGDLYLQYGNPADIIYLGEDAGATITDNGTQYSGNAATATIAVNDSMSQHIAATYIKGIAYNYTNKSIPELVYTFGDNDTAPVNMPVATDTNGGIITIDAQTFKGAKTFKNAVIVEDYISAINNISTTKQFVSTIADGTAPMTVVSKTVVTNLNADFVDGKHASNDIFTANGASEHIVPTQRAIVSSMNDMLMASQALVYRGLINPNDSTTFPPTPVVSGSVYVISHEGTFNGEYCEPGDIVIGYYIASTNKTQWDIIQNNINGAVVIKDGGTVNRTDITQNAVPRFDTTNGRVIKNSKLVINDAGTLLPITHNTQDIGTSDNRWKVIYSTKFVGMATNAQYDDVEGESGGTLISKKYIAAVALQDHATAPYYQAYDGTNNQHSTFALPVASETKAGVITTGTQVITGAKTIDNKGSLTIDATSGFTYIGIEVGGSASYRNMWFSHSSKPGTPVINDNLKYNPASTEKWEHYDDATPTAYGSICQVGTTNRFQGISYRALKDDMGDTIKKKYFAAVALTDHASAPYYTFYDGTNNPFSPTLPLPVASDKTAGIITTIAQTLTGAKTIDANGSLTIAGPSAFFFTGIQENITAGNRPIWFAHKDRVTTPSYNSDFYFNPSSTTAWEHLDGTTAPAHELLTVARIKGLAFQALKDDTGNTIKHTYFAGVGLTNHASAPYYTFYDGVNNAFSPTLPLPVANATNAGIITTGDQTITGKKTIDANGSLYVAGASAFYFTGIQTNTTGGARPIWFAHKDRLTTPSYNNSFTFNPGSTVGWQGKDGDTTSPTATAHGLITADRFRGLAYQALYDDISTSVPIKKKYVAGITLTEDGAAPYYIVYDGTNNHLISSLRIPVASNTYAGVITTGAQTITGAKTIDSNGSLTVAKAGGFNYSGIQDDAATDSELKIWFGAAGTPKNAAGLTYRPKDKSLTVAGQIHGKIDKADADGFGDNIATKYLNGASLNSAGFEFTFTHGDNNNPITLKPNFAASGSCGGQALSAAVADRVESFDTRAATRTPQDTPKGITLNFKQNSTYGLSDGGSYIGLMSWRSYSTGADLTGGYPIEIAYTANGNLWTRLGTGATTWGSWTKILTEANFGTKLDARYLRKDQADSTAYQLSITNSTEATSAGAGALKVTGGIYAAKKIYGSQVYNAVWNDYAEFRQAETIEPGRVIIEDASGEMKVSTERLMPGGNIVSDTFGHAMGETDECKTPIAVAGRVLAYPLEDRNSYPLGAAVCTGPNGTVSLMTREEIREYPERIIGTVSEIPNYEVWGTGNVEVNGRIWIKVK